MYLPEEPGERVETYFGDGEYTGETGQYGEHFEIELDDGEVTKLHYEDILGPAKSSEI